MKTEPISFRPSQSLDSRLEALRERTGMAKSRLVELLADEAERVRRYPGLAFRGPDQRRRPWMIGSPFDVWEIVQAWQDLKENADAAQAQLALSPRQLNLALAYYREFADDIDRSLGLARRSSKDLQAGYPFIEVLRVEA